MELIIALANRLLVAALECFSRLRFLENFLNFYLGFAKIKSLKRGYTNMSRKELNQVVLVGRVGKDPEIKYFESGTSMAMFSLAINRPTKDKKTDWFDIKLWGRQAEIAGEYVRKGSLIGIEGNLDFDSWNDKTTGELQVKPVILGSNLRLLGGRNDNQVPENN